MAELGDKTQLATLLFAANAKNPKFLVFLGPSAALIATSAIGVLVGSIVSQYVYPKAAKLQPKLRIKIDGFVKSPKTGHCEERSDAAISSARD